MPHSFSYAVSMNLEHSIKEGSHERYPVHLHCFKNIKKIKYPDFQAMTVQMKVTMIITFKSKHTKCNHTVESIMQFNEIYQTVQFSELYKVGLFTELCQTVQFNEFYLIVHVRTKRICCAN